MAIGTWNTLAEAKKLTREMKIAGVIDEIIEAGGLLPRLPGLTVGGKSVVYNREKTIPTGNFIAIDGTLTPQAVVDLDEITVALKILECTIDLDHFIVDTYPTINDMRAQALSMARKGFARKLEDTIIYGNSGGQLAGDPAAGRAFDGMHSLKAVAMTLQSKTSGGAPAALSLAKLDELIDKVKPKPDVLVMSFNVRRRLSQSLRSTGVAGYISWMRDDFGKQILVYNDLPVIASDYVVQTEQTTYDAATTWATGTAYSLGDFVIPTTPNGYVYECTVAGTSHASVEPTWPTVVGDTVADNTVTWTTRQPTYNAKTGGVSSSIFAIRFGTPDNGGVGLLAGGGDVFQAKSVPQLESKLTGREILYSFIAMSLGSTLSLGVLDGVTDAAVVA